MMKIIRDTQKLKLKWIFLFAIAIISLKVAGTLSLKSSACFQILMLRGNDNKLN